MSEEDKKLYTVTGFIAVVVLTVLVLVMGKSSDMAELKKTARKPARSGRISKIRNAMKDGKADKARVPVAPATK